MAEARGLPPSNMPVYHFTLHAYRSWSPSHPRGYTQRGKGYLPPNIKVAQKYDDRAKAPMVRFTPNVQRIILRATRDFCARRNFRLHACAHDPSHCHLILSWPGYSAWHEVLRRLKNILSLELNRCLNCTRKWFVRGGSRKRVKDASHLEHLIDSYLPDHKGLFWREGLPLP